MKTVKIIAILLIVIVGLPVLLWFDFYVWRLKHPQAPTWTFFIKE